MDPFENTQSIEDIDPPEAEASRSAEAAGAWQSGWAAGYMAAVEHFRATRPVYAGKCDFHRSRTWWHAEGVRCDCPCHSPRRTGAIVYTDPETRKP